MLITMEKPDFVFNDRRGSLIQLVHGGYQQVNVIECKKGTFRGGHYHRINTEAFFVIRGKFILLVEKNGIIENYEFGANSFFSIDRDVRHSFTYLEDTLLVSLYDHGVELEDGEKDIVTDTQ